MCGIYRLVSIFIWLTNVLAAGREMFASKHLVNFDKPIICEGQLYSIYDALHAAAEAETQDLWFKVYTHLADVQRTSYPKRHNSPDDVYAFPGPYFVYPMLPGKIFHNVICESHRCPRPTSL